MFHRTKPSFWIASLCVFLAIAFQIQVTLFHSYEAYKGIRICLADAALPIAGIAILWSLITQTSQWPTWRLPHPYLWLTGLFLVLVAALLQTHSLYDQWSHWGIVNKLSGIMVVSAYFCLGGWIGQNASPDHLKIFFRALFLFFIGMMVAELGGLFWQDFYNYFQYISLWPDYPLQGLMDNRNVYALFVLIIVSFMMSFHAAGTPLLPKAVTYITIGLLPYFVMQIGSRACFIAGAVMLIMLAIFYGKKIVPFILCLAAGTLLVIGLYYKTPEKLLLIHYDQLDIVNHVEELGDRTQSINEVANTLSYTGDNFRLQVLKISKDMIMERPISGSGLGSSFIVQAEKRDGRYDVIENTPLWLWVETGLFGLLTFVAFYILCVRGIIRGIQTQDLFYATIHKGVLISVGIFTVMCLFHEMMLTRQVWFLLGLSLALPLRGAVKMRPAE